MRVTASVFCSSIRPERRDFAESFATEVIPLRSGRHNLEKIGRRGWKPRLSKQKQSVGHECPTHTSLLAGEGARATFRSCARLHFSDPWLRAGRFPAPCAEAMARRVLLVEIDRGCAQGFDKVWAANTGVSHLGNLSSRTDFG